jgi:hypothetical protein
MNDVEFGRRAVDEGLQKRRLVDDDAGDEQRLKAIYPFFALILHN